MDDENRQLDEGKTAAEVTVGSVTVVIRRAPVTVMVKKNSAEGDPPNGENGAPASRTYDSYQIAYHEGTQRLIKRAKTLDKAKKRAKEIATRLSRLGPQAEYLNETDRRVYVLARSVARPLGLPVDEVCRRYAELQRRLKEGTLEQAVDFKNNHGQGVRDDVANSELFEVYIADLEKRGVGVYHLRDTKRYVGNFVDKFPSTLGKISTERIDRYLGGLGGRAANKNHHRDAIIAYYNFARDKSYLPLRHAPRGRTDH